MAAKEKNNLTRNIVIGMLLGLIVGVCLNMVKDVAFLQDYLVNGLFHVVGAIFIKSLKMLVVPLVFVSLVCGVCSLKDITKLGKIGGKTLGLYLFTTAVAITIALTIANLVNPGEGFDQVTDASYTASEPPSLTEVIINMFPSNPLESMAEGSMLQVIVFAILFGLAIAMAGEPGKRISAVFVDLNVIIMKLVMMLMALAPYGVFCLLGKVFATQGFSAIQPLLKYFILVLGVLLIHGSVTYPTLLKLLSGLNPLIFLRKFKSVLMFAFSTSSSNATIPVTLKTVKQKLGVNNSIASFTIPLGATINMDGTAIMQGCATVFIAQAYNIDIGMADYLAVVLTATLASIGTAGVPGVGLIMLAMVLKQVGLPVEGIGLIIGVDRLLDMCRTAVNVTGDAMVSCVVAKSEGEFSREVFYDESDA